MATLGARDTEAHLGAPLYRPKPFVESLRKSSEAMKIDSETQHGNIHRLLAHSSKGLKPSSSEGKQGPGAKSLEEEHAEPPPSMPELEASKSLGRTDLSPKKRDLYSSHKIEQETSPEIKASSLGIKKLADRRDASEAPSAENLPEYKTNPSTSSLDTAVPCESVKEAATLFGERVQWSSQSQTFQEKRFAPGFDTLKANKEILHCKERLATEEASIVEVLQELEKAKEQMRLFEEELPATSVGEATSLPPDQAPNQPEEVSNASVAKDFYMDVLHEVKLAEEEVEHVLDSRSKMEKLKQLALRECEVEMIAEDHASMRVKELVKERETMEESLEALEGALYETEAGISFLKSIAKLKLEGDLEVESVQRSHERLKSLESTMTEADTSIETIMKELSTIRGAQMNEFECELLGAKARLDQAKIVEGNKVAALGRALEQLDETKINLKKAIGEGASLMATVGALQAEVSKRQIELESAHETEQIACATLASLQDELFSVKAKVLSAQAGETKAREAKRSLPDAIKQLALDADEAKLVSKAAREEAHKGRLEIEQAKVGLNTALSKLQATQKEVEAVRASEAMALAEFTALSEPGSELGEKIKITISFEEYHALHDAGHEAEEAANKKVAAVLVQVNTAAASEQKVQEKLDTTLKELQVLLKDMEEAQKKADDAQVAKLSIEAELRKWRAEHEQWRKTGSNPSSVSTSVAQSPRFANDKSSQGRLISQSFNGKLGMGLDSLAEVLTLKVPSSEKASKVVPEMELPEKAGEAKKMSFFTRILSIVACNTAR